MSISDGDIVICLLVYPPHPTCVQFGCGEYVYYSELLSVYRFKCVVYAKSSLNLSVKAHLRARNSSFLE